MRTMGHLVLAALAVSSASPAPALPPPLELMGERFPDPRNYRDPGLEADLSEIARVYPELADRAGKLREAYLASPLHEGARVLLPAGKGKTPDETEALLRRLEKDHPGYFTGGSHSGSPALATAFLSATEATLQHGGSGYTLFQADCLAHVPAYRDAPLLEYTAGWKVRFQRQETAAMHRLEATRDRLLADTDVAMGELIEQFPTIDRQHLRSLVRQANAEKESNKPPRAYREIFQLLKELAPGEDAEQGGVDGLEEETP